MRQVYRAMAGREFRRISELFDGLWTCRDPSWIGEWVTLLFMVAAVLKLALLVVAAQGSSPNLARERVERIRNSKPPFEAIERIHRIRDAVAKVNVDEIGPSEGMVWADIFYEVQWYSKSILVGERYLSVKRSPVQQRDALGLLLYAYADARDAKGTLNALERYARLAQHSEIPFDHRLHIATGTATKFCAVLLKESGPDAALRGLDLASSLLPGEPPEIKYRAQLNETIVLLALGRAESLLAKGRAVDASRVLQEVKPRASKDLAVVIDAFLNDLTLVGNPAPPLKAIATIGDFESLTALRGKVVLLDFMAHWCVPCIEEFKVLRPLEGELRTEGLHVVSVTSFFGYYGAENGLAQGEELKRMKGFVLQHGLIWPVAFIDAKDSAQFGVKSLPTLILIDRQGIVRGKWSGYNPSEFEIVKSEVRRLVRETTVAVNGF